MNTFGNRPGLAAIVLLAAMAGLLAPSAGATPILLSNLPVNGGLQLAMFNTQAYGAGFTLLADYVLDTVTIRLKTSSVAPTPAQVSVSLYTNNGHEPGSFLEALDGPPSFSASTTANYVYSPASPVTLNSGQEYWVVVHFTGSLTLYWIASNPPEVATGPGATYDRTMLGNPFGSGWTHQLISGQDAAPSLEITGTALTGVPEPGTLGAMLIGFAGLLVFQKVRQARAKRQ